MSLNNAGNNTLERVPPRAGSSDYVASPGMVDQAREWYEYDPLRYERPGRIAPDEWYTLSATERDGRTFLVLKDFKDAMLEVSYRLDGQNFRDVEVTAVPTDKAYQLALDRDDEAIKEGAVIYNERHPRP